MTVKDVCIGLLGLCLLLPLGAVLFVWGFVRMAVEWSLYRMGK